MKTLKAVVAILRNSQGQLLIARRQSGQFMADFWELPGGKIQPAETSAQALTRELFEELGIESPQLGQHNTLTHTYPDRRVILDIYQIDEYRHTAHGKEGQQIAWVLPKLLKNYTLLPTMPALISAMDLPDKYWITPATEHGSKQWMAQFERQLSDNIRLIQLRSKTELPPALIAKLSQKCQQNQTKLLLNLPNQKFDSPACDGYHLSTKTLLQQSKRPCGYQQLLGASAHCLSEVLKAQTLGADFALISPVQFTKTHPNAKPIGWECAAEIAHKVQIPVYFLGGMKSSDLARAHKLGAQGIAGVSGF